MGKKTSASNTNLVFEELEPRLLLSADGLAVITETSVATLQDIVHSDNEHTIIVQQHDEQVSTSVLNKVQQEQRTELVILDPRAPNFQQLHNDVIKAQQQGRDINVVILDAHRDGIDQISEALSKYNKLDAVHIVSHGSDGQLQLGATQLNKTTLHQRQSDISNWKDTFTAGGDLLIYGCNLADTQDGKSLVDSISKLTATDVAASDDLTGNELLGGDWDLEYTLGQLETEIAFSENTQQQWQGSLASPVANNDSYSVTEDQTLIINALTENATSSDLIAAWQLDEGTGSTTVDAAGNGIDGTVNGATWTPSSRTGDSALQFDGVNDSVSLGSDAAIDNIFSGGGTVSAWINPADWGGGNYGRILDKSGDKIASDGWALELNGTDGSLRFEHGFSTNNGGWNTSPGSISLGSWQHVAVVYDNGSDANDPQIYIDGILQTISEDRTPSGTPDSDAARNLAMGAYPSDLTRNFEGVIDEVAIYNRDLTGTEINALFSTGVIANDTDSDGDTLTASVVTGPANGTLSLNSDGSFTYTPDANFNGTDSFTYKVNDGVQDSNTATVDITVNPVNDAPVIDLDANDDSGQTGLDFITSFIDGDPPISIVDSDVSLVDVEDNLISITVTLTNNLEPGGNKEMLSAIASGGLLVSGNGTDVLTISGSGTVAEYLTVLSTVKYQNTQNNPDTTDRTIEFVADDGTDTSLLATTTVRVFTSAPGNNIPVAQANTVSTLEDNAYSFSAADFTYFDVDGHALVSATITSQSLAGGTLTHSGGTTVTDGDTLTAAQLDTLIYTPLPDANGAPLATFAFAVNDSDPGTVFAQMDIDITSVNDVPMNSIPGVQAVDEDIVLNISGISVSDVDGDIDNVALGVSNGTLAVTLQGGATISAGANNTSNLALSGSEADINATLATLTYLGNTDFYGADILTVITTDTSAASDTDTVNITVNPVNDAPDANDDNYSVAQDNTLIINALTDNPTAVDLEAAWQFEEGSGATTDDATGNGNDAVINGATWTTSSRTGDAALSFDGTNDYVQTASSTLDLSTAMNFTLSAWFKTDTTAGQNHILWQGVSTENGWGTPGVDSPLSSEMNLSVGHWDYPDKITFFMGYHDLNPASIDITSASTFTDTSGWHLATVVVSDIGGGELQADLYVDGVLEGSDTGTQIDRSQWDTDLRIGRGGPEGRNFDGMIDEVGIYDRALNATEVSALFANGVIANDTDTEGDVLSASVVTGPSNGTLSLNTNGSFTYTPNAGYTGTDSFTYKVNDGALDSNTATVTIDVTNTPPVATNDPGDFNSTIASYNPISYWQLGEAAGGTAADAGSAGVSATLNGVTLGQPGAINGDANTAISFDGTDDYVEIAHDSTYMLDDGTIQLWFNADDVNTQQGLISKDSSGFDNGGHFTISLKADGSIETRLQSSTASYYVTSAAGSLTAGDWHHVAVTFGAGGMELFLDGVSVDTNAYTGGLGTTSGGTGNDEPIAIGGSTVNSDNGSVLVSPETEPRSLFSGSVDEVAIIGQALTAEQIQNLYASALQNYSIAEDSSLVVPASEGVLINDSDMEGSALTAVLVTGPSNASSFTLNADGSFNYTPVANFSGTDTFTYVANDGNADSNVATVTITITGDNDAPVHTVPGTPFTVLEDTQTAIAGISVADPDAGAGIISTQLSVTDGVLDVMLSGAATISAGSNSSNTLTISGNVTDINATLVSLQYTGNTNVNGTAADTLTVVTNDLGNTGTGGAKSDTDTVQINITAVNDAPSVTAVSLGNINEDASITITQADLLAGSSDADGDALSAINLVLNTGSGTLTDNMDGTWGFSPSANWNGAVSFDFEVSDATTTTANTASLTVDAVNDTPVAGDDTVASGITEDVLYNSVTSLLANDTDLDLDSLTVVAGTFATSQGGSITFNADGSYSYTSASNFNGVDTVNYTVTDGALTDTGLLTLTVTAVNDAAIIAGVDTGLVTEDVDPDTDTFLEVGGTLTITDVDAGEASFNAGVLAGTYGNLNIDVNGNWNYSADNTQAAIQNMDAAGTLTDTITVTSFDGTTHNIVITIGGVNDAPNAQDDTPVAVDEGGTAIFDLAINDLDIDNAIDLNSISITGAPSNGSLIVNGNGTVTYTHDGSETTSDSFSYTIADITGAISNIATVDVTINPINDAPSAVGDVRSVDEGNTVNIDLSANDADVDNALDLTSIVIVGAPTNGVLIVNANGTVDYTHDGSQTLSDSFSYTISDISGAVSNVATVNITVNPVNNAPTTIGIVDVTVTEDSSATNIDLNAAFDDVDNLDSELTYSITGNTSIGLFNSAAVNAVTGELVLDYAADVSGASQISIRATDPSGASVDTLFTVTVTPVNDAPVLAENTGMTVQGASSAVISNAELNVDDIDDTAATITYTVTALPSNGVLMLNGVPVTINSSFTEADVMNGAVSYQADGSAADDEFVFTVSDSAGSSITNNTFIINVLLSPPSPEATPETTDPSPTETTSADPVISAEPDVIEKPVVAVPDRELADKYTGGSARTIPQPQLTIEPTTDIKKTSVENDILDYYDDSIEIYKASNLTFSTVSTVADIQVKSIKALWVAIDEMKDKMDEKITEDITEIEFRAAAVSSSGVALTAGVVAWVLRSGALMTSLISTIPLWKGYDPLPILAYKDDDDEEENIAEDKIPTSLEEMKKIKALKERMNKQNQVDNLFDGSEVEG